MNVSPIQIINDAIKAQGQRPYPEDAWTASSAGYCMRATFLARKQVPRTLVRTDRNNRVLWASQKIHDMAQSIVKGENGSQEREIVIPDLNVIGHCDDIMDLEGLGLTVVDYKGQHSGAFHYVKREGTMLKPWQRLQIGTYMYGLKKEGLDIKHGMLVYISRDDWSMEQALIPYTDELERDVVNFWTELNGYWNRNELPPCTCGVNGKWEKAYCAYGNGKDTCCDDKLFGETFGHQITLEEVLV